MSDSIEKRIWFYYASENQVGPMTESEIRGAIAQGQVSPNDYVYRDGFADWKHLKDVTELADELAQKQAPSPSDRRSHSKRVPIQELVVAHNDVHVASGFISNISTSGIFLETSDSVFKVNDELKLTLKDGKGLGKPMHLRATVVRHANDARYAMGYGLELRELDDAARARISEYVKRYSQAS